SGADANGYGYTDFMPIAYTNLVDVPSYGASASGNLAYTTGEATTARRMPGALAMNIIGALGAQAGVPSAISTLPTDYPLGKDGPTAPSIVDGLSKTIALIEDVGRGETWGTPRYDDPLPDPPGFNNGRRAAWRWAEPDTANGISGPNSNGSVSLDPTYPQRV